MSARKTLTVAEKDALKRAAFPILLRQYNIDIFGSGHGIASSPNRGNDLCPFHTERAPVPKAHECATSGRAR